MYHSLFIAVGIEAFGDAAVILPVIVIYFTHFSVWITDLHKIKS